MDNCMDDIKIGIEKIYYMTKDEIQKLINDKPNLFKTDYFVVMEYLFKFELIEVKITEDHLWYFVGISL